MIVKVILGTMQNARKLVSIAESIPCDVELCYGRYVVNAKSMLGVLSMPEFDGGELHIHTDNEKECEKILFQLLDQNLIVDTGDAVKRSIYDITTFGEILIDFTSQDINEDGQMLYARNPGGAPANVAVAASRLGAHTAFIGKAGKDMHGMFLRKKTWIPRVCSWTKIILLHWLLWKSARLERGLSLLQENRERIRRSRRKKWMWMCWIIPIFFMLDPCP